VCERPSGQRGGWPGGEVAQRISEQAVRYGGPERRVDTASPDQGRAAGNPQGLAKAIAGVGGVCQCQEAGGSGERELVRVVAPYGSFTWVGVAGEIASNRSELGFFLFFPFFCLHSPRRSLIFIDL